MAKARKEALVSKTLAKLAKRAGVVIHLEPQWRVVGQIELPNGRKSYFRNSALDLNPLGASTVASDKDYAAYFMRRMGYPAVPGEAFYSDALCKAVRSRRNIHAAWRYAKKRGLPVIVKPNNKWQGMGVAKVHGKEEFYRAARAVLRHSSVLLVQEALQGRDYRIVVLDREVISAYERIPLRVAGDGRRTILQLLMALQRQFKKTGRDTIIDPKDFRIKTKLRREKLTLRSVPAKGRIVVLLDNANLSTGGMAVDVTKTIHPAFKKIAVALTRDMGLRYSGVDLMVLGSITEPPRKYWVLELNDAPGLDHYVTIGKAQEKIVDALYLKVLRAVRKMQ